MAKGIDRYRYFTALVTELNNAMTAEDLAAVGPRRIALIER